MRVFSKTDIGKVRDMNQDYYFVSDENEKLHLFILADGMGGYSGGEIASKMTVEIVRDYIYEHWNAIEQNDNEIQDLIKLATLRANELVYKKSREIEELKEMGTTLDVCLILNDKIYISHIGDSRVYKISENEIKCITSDHTYVQQLLKDGTITKEEAEIHPDRHMLIKALGCNEIIEPDFYIEQWKDNEMILLCSDGLTNLVKDNEIQRIVLNDLVSPEKSLVNAANDSGGIDNITVIIIKNKMSKI